MCELTISYFFLHALQFSGSMVKPNLIPLDKFRSKNVADMMKLVDFGIQVVGTFQILLDPVPNRIGAGIDTPKSHQWCAYSGSPDQ